MNAEEFDRLFDDGADMADHLDLDTLKRPNLELETVAVELPAWIVRSLDRQALAAHVTRDAVIRLWLSERFGEPQPQALAAE